jgi:predicted DsbA family dithiol-disulfide isomerase
MARLKTPSRKARGHGTSKPEPAAEAPKAEPIKAAEPAKADTVSIPLNHAAVAIAAVVVLLAAALVLTNPSILPMPKDGTGLVTASSAVVAANSYDVRSSADAKASLELFVMSQCPFGTQAETLAKPAIEKFGKDLNFSIHFIATESASGFTSLHGQPEVDENLRQVCIIKKTPEKFFDYVSCINEDYQRAGSIWRDCAAKAGLDSNAINSCATGDEGKQLLRENIKRSNELDIGSSPTYYINGEPFEGGRDERALTRGVCQASPELSLCKSLPPEPQVNMIIVNDASCASCNPAGVVSQLKAYFYNLSTRTVDYASPEGAALVKQFGITSVPAFVFDSSIEKHEVFNDFQRYLRKDGGLYYLPFQGDKLIGRAAAPKRVDLFVMSQCPFGTQAENALKEITENIPELQWDIHFIATDTGSGFESLHGQPEVDEDVRQSCILADNRDKFFDYVSCINADYRNAGSLWRGCAEKAGLSPASIDACVSTRGPALLRERIALANELNIGASPTWLANNQTVFGGIYAEGAKQSICSANPGLAGCEKTLSGPSQTVSAGGGCQV